MNGGAALFGDGTSRGRVKAGSVVCDRVEGCKWNKPSLAGFNGAAVATVGCGNVSFSLSANSSSVSAAKNSIGAKARVAKNTGVMKISYTNGNSTCKGTGVAYVMGGVLHAFGGGTDGRSRFSFTVR